MNTTPIAPPERPRRGWLAVAVVGAAAGGGYVVAVGWPAQLPVTALTTSTVYAVGVAAALVVAYLLHSRARTMGEPRWRWLAWGFGLIGVVTLLQALSLEPAETAAAVSATPDAMVARSLLWQLLLPTAALGGLLAPRRRALRWAVMGLLTALVLATVSETLTATGRLGLVDATGGFTAAFRVAVVVLAMYAAAVTTLWFATGGRRPARVHAWIGIGLLLVTFDVVLAAGADFYLGRLWLAGAALRPAQVVLPAVGVLAEFAALLRVLRRHEQSLSERLRLERELAETSLLPTVHSREERLMARMRVESALDGAGLRAVFQPVYAVATGEVLLVEALARIDLDPRRPPNEWFAEAASVGLGKELELATLRCALDGLAHLPEPVRLVVNVSPALLIDERFSELLRTHGAHRLVAEVSEHAVVKDYPHLTEVLDELRAQGLEIAVDDAGAGFCSLRHVTLLRPEYVKLDASLTARLDEDPFRQALLDALAGFAEQTGHRLIAKRVESSEELAAVVEHGVQLVQGHLFTYPGPLPPEPDAIGLEARGDLVAAASGAGSGALR